ncbi:MAG: hypothetical protein ACR2G4_11515 [Pyrinomonadaceae bacterium]
MSIANELSCDVAAAVLTRRATPPATSDPVDLSQMVLAFHTTLRGLTGEDRKRRRAQVLDAPPPASNTSAAGN